MPSFDVVSEVDLQEVRNAIANANRELTSRWDFRQVYTRIELNEKSETITASTESDFQLRQLLDILCGHLVKRGIDSQALAIPEQVERSGKFFSVEITLKQGIDTPLAKKIVKLIKESTLKVQAQIQEKQVRITGKSRDSLQQSIALIRNNDLGQPFQFTNFRD